MLIPRNPMTCCLRACHHSDTDVHRLFMYIDCTVRMINTLVYAYTMLPLHKELMHKHELQPLDIRVLPLEYGVVKECSGVTVMSRTDRESVTRARARELTDASTRWWWLQTAQPRTTLILASPRGLLACCSHSDL